MKVFCTSKNSGPDYSSAHITTLLYLGTSEHEAKQLIADYAKYEKPRDKWPENTGSYSALPANMDQEMIAFYTADGWWWSVVMVDL